MSILFTCVYLAMKVRPPPSVTVTHTLSVFCRDNAPLEC